MSRTGAGGAFPCAGYIAFNDRHTALIAEAIQPSARPESRGGPISITSCFATSIRIWSRLYILTIASCFAVCHWSASLRRS